MLTVQDAIVLRSAVRTVLTSQSQRMMHWQRWERVPHSSLTLEHEFDTRDACCKPS